MILRFVLVLFSIWYGSATFAGSSTRLLPAPPTRSDTIIVRFEYKQSALYQAYTNEVMDSVVNILKKNPEATLSIDGYAHMNEGNDTILKYLSLNRAIFVKDYILGRGIDLARIKAVQGFGASRPYSRGIDAEGNALNCRAEIVIIYPMPPPPPVIADRDLDGVPDEEDKCPDVYGYAAQRGCPDTNTVVVPFDKGGSSLISSTYKVLDSVISILKNNPSFTLSISGHAHKEEGSHAMCSRLAQERADVVKSYLYSRQISVSRIDALENMSDSKPLNAARNPQEITKNARAEILLNRH